MRSTLFAALFAVVFLFFTSTLTWAQSQNPPIGIGVHFGATAVVLDDGHARSIEVYVMGLVCDGPAHKAGIQINDSISAIDGKEVIGLTREELVDVTSQLRGIVGEVVTLTIFDRDIPDGTDTIDVNIYRALLSSSFTSTECPVE